MANYFEHNLNPQNSASEERKKYLRHIDPERLAKVYKEGEHRRHKGTQKGELFEEQAPERVENAILGPDWCDHLSPEEHSAESIYLIHGVSAETKEFDETGKTIDLRRLHYYMQSGLPQEKEMCGSLIAKDLGGGNRLAFRSAGFIVTPQLITRVFYQDIGSERSDVEDVPPKTSGVRKVKGELDSFYNAEESVPAHGAL